MEAAATAAEIEWSENESCEEQHEYNAVKKMDGMELE